MSINEKTLIFYPRSYNKRGQDHLHSVQGITQDGRDVNVKLRLSDELKKEYGDQAPSISEFSRTDLKAKMPCVASEDNGPKLGDKAEGIILFKNVVEEKEGVYIAEDARVVKISAEDAHPIIGMGRIDIHKDVYDVIEARKRLAEASESGDVEKVKELKKIINDPFNYAYRAHLYKYDDSQVLSDLDQVKKSIADSIDKNTKNGIIGGVLVKGYDQSGRVKESSVFEYFTKFHSVRQEYLSGYETVQAMLNEHDDVFDDLGADIDKVMIMPIVRYNCGAKGNRAYAQRYSKLVDLFYNSDYKPLLSEVVITVKYIQEGESTLLSKVHTLNPIKGKLSAFDNIGGFKDILDDQDDVIIINGSLTTTDFGIQKKEDFVFNTVQKENFKVDSELAMGAITSTDTNECDEQSEDLVVEDVQEELDVTAGATGMLAFLQKRNKV